MENPPAVVQLEWVTPWNVKGNTHVAPDTVEHPEEEDDDEAVVVVIALVRQSAEQSP